MHGWTDLLGDWESAQALVRASYNVTPTSQIMALVPQNSDRDLRPQAMRWGMVPGWSKEFASKYATFNARAETVADKPTFKSAWKQGRRCIVPMAGYYEWQASSLPESAKPVKQPFYISDPHVGILLAAALYEPWGQSGDCSVTIMTKPATESLAALHTRMPILLNRDTIDEWLNSSNEHLEAWWPTVQNPDLLYWPVSQAVGNVRNDEARLIEPIDV